jgi:glycosyltransferase involved in cell wall biosynthesis
MRRLRFAATAAARAAGESASAGARGQDHRRLRILLVLKTAEGGLWTLPHVDELRRRGHHVAAILPPERGRLRTALVERGVPVTDSLFPFGFTLTLGTVVGLWRLRRQIRDLAPDVVHYHLYASALAARLATLGMRLTKVHMVAGPLYLDSPIISRVERILCRLDHVTIGGSDHTSQRYRAFGLTVSRTPTIPYGVDTCHFMPPSAAERLGARATLGVAPDAFVVIMVAFVYGPRRHVYKGRAIKGHDVLLDAWGRFRTGKARARLLLVGGGFDERGEAHRRDLVDRFHIAEDQSITWLHSMPDVRSYYAAADVSVCPSLSENHGAALEASAMAVPCIVSDAGALPETVDERSGWVIPRDDVPPLVSALESAYAEFESGALAVRGRRARARMSRLFSQRAGAVRVAEVIEVTAHDRDTAARPPSLTAER